MCLLSLYNNLSRKKEQFKPLEALKVKMYTCGPSTYQPSHIGNYRTFLFEDLLQRYLEYLGYTVTRLITLTNVEDKAIKEAENEHLTFEELTNRNEAIFFKDFQSLKIKHPDFAVRASTIIDQAASLIECLVQKHIAYKYRYKNAENIYYDPMKFPGFGKLAHLDMKKWPKKKRRFHLDTYPGTPWNRGDFILWHGCQTTDAVCWDTEIGKGRPAWNIQDAAMVIKHLGFQVDIACGGVDNLVRHHDYTIAVAEGVSGKKFAAYWLHCAHLLADGKKMSKSLGNVHYPEDLIEQGYSGDHVRFFLIYTNYRQSLNFTWTNLANARKKLDELKSMIKRLQGAQSRKPNSAAAKLANSIVSVFEEHMNDDLNVRAAVDAIYSIVAKLEKMVVNGELGSAEATEALRCLRKVDEVIQVIF